MKGTKVEIRIYKLFDTDLVALADSGFPVCEMMKTAVICYANGSPANFIIDEPLYFDLNRKKNVRLRFNIPPNDQKTLQLLKNIKHGYRNSFCKMVLRDAMVRQNLSCYFAEQELIDVLHKHNIAVPRHGVIALSSLKKDKRALTALIKKSLGDEVASAYIEEEPVEAEPVEAEREVVEPPKEKPAPSPAPVKKEPRKKTEPKGATDILAAFDAL